MGEFAKILSGTLQIEMDLHRRTCAGVGISAEELEATEPAPTCLGYTSWMMAIAETGTALDAAAALLPCFWGYEEIGRRLKERGLPDVPEYRDWIETYASEEFAALTPWMRDWIDARAPGLPGADRRRIDGIFRTAGRWEYLFWEMAWRGETWPV
jgi:thiaminase/transcriptional activator TenA